MFELVGAQFGCSGLELTPVPAWAPDLSWGRAAAPICVTPTARGDRLRHGEITYA